MSQGVEGYVGVPANVPGGQKVRQLVFNVVQTDGTMQAVLVEAVAIVDPRTGMPVPMMSLDQGDIIIGLLGEILEALRHGG